MYDNTPLSTFTYDNRTVSYRSNDINEMIKAARQTLGVTGGKWVRVQRNDYLWMPK